MVVQRVSKRERRKRMRRNNEIAMTERCDVGTGQSGSIKEIKNEMEMGVWAMCGRMYI